MHDLVNLVDTTPEDLEGEGLHDEVLNLVQGHAALAGNVGKEDMATGVLVAREYGLDERHYTELLLQKSLGGYKQGLGRSGVYENYT